jgi:hypothetical protein
VRYFFDRNIPKAVVKALSRVRNDVQGHDSMFAQDTLDEEWLPQVTELGMVVVTRDKSMALYPAGREALASSGAVVVCNADGGGFTTWDFFELLIKRWSKIEEIAASSEPGVYFYTRSRNPYLKYAPSKMEAPQTA